MRAIEGHLRRQQAFDAAAELLLEVVLVQAQLVEVQKEIVTGQVALAHGALAHDGHVSGFNGLVVLLQAERVHVQRAVEVRDRAAADAGVLVVGNLQLLGVQVMVVGALLVQAVERPDGVAAEEGMLTAAQHLVEDLVVAELAVVVHLAQRLLHLARGGV